MTYSGGGGTPPRPPPTPLSSHRPSRSTARICAYSGSIDKVIPAPRQPAATQSALASLRAPRKHAKPRPHGQHALGAVLHTRHEVLHALLLHCRRGGQRGGGGAMDDEGGQGGNGNMPSNQQRANGRHNTWWKRSVQVLMGQRLAPMRRVRGGRLKAKRPGW